MKILLDTQIFLWAITEDVRLSGKRRATYMSEANDLYLSVASIWEMLIKSGLGKLPLPSPSRKFIADELERNRVGILPIQMTHLDALESLPPIHRDPFDRMLIAQALAEGWPIMSADADLKKYRVKIL